MKKELNIQTFEQHTDKNLNISDVSDSKLYSEKDIKTAVATGIVIWQDRKEQTIGGLYAEIMKYLKEHQS